MSDVSAKFKFLMKKIKNNNQLFYQYILYWLLIFTTAAVSILACVPPVDRDALTHHLFIPKLYLQFGGITEIPHIIFSYYPMNLDLLYMVPLYFNNDILPKFIHFTFALLTALMIYRYLHKRINTVYALLGALFFLTIPVVVRLSSSVYVDLGLICFLFASLLYLFRWIEAQFRPKYLIFSAVYCGLALGTKYNGLIGLFLLGLFVAFVYSRYHAGQKWHGIKSVGWCAAFIMIALIVFSPWMIRNLAWTGNPVYPLYNNVFKAESVLPADRPDTVLAERDRMTPIQTRHQIYGESWIQIALIPLRVFFQGQDDSPKYFDGKINPFLLLLPIFAFFGNRFNSRQEKTEKLLMFFFSVLFLLFACAQTGIRIRYFSPILPPLVVLSMFGIYNIQTVLFDRAVPISARLKKMSIFVIIFVMLGLNAMYIADRFKRDQPMAYLTGRVTRDDYIQAYRPEYASFQYANKSIAKDSKILGLYIGNRGYYSDIPIDFSIEILQQIAAKAESGNDVARYLDEEGFTHLLVNFSLFNYWVKKYSLDERKMLKFFFDHNALKEFSRDGYGLLRIVR